MWKRFCSFFSHGNVLFISCEKYTKLASRSMDSGLNAIEKPGFFFHHIICTVCRRFKRQIHLIDRATKNIDQVHSGDCCHKLSSDKKREIQGQLKNVSQ